MGVDYRANYGFGFEVYQSEESEETYIGEQLEELLVGTPYTYFEIGDGCYSGDDNTFFVVLKDEHPLRTLEARARELLKFLNDNKIETTDDVPYTVGGLHVY